MGARQGTGMRTAPQSCHKVVQLGVEDKNIKQLLDEASFPTKGSDFQSVTILRERFKLTLTNVKIWE